MSKLLFIVSFLIMMSLGVVFSCLMRKYLLKNIFFKSEKTTFWNEIILEFIVMIPIFFSMFFWGFFLVIIKYKTKRAIQKYYSYSVNSEKITTFITAYNFYFFHK